MNIECGQDVLDELSAAFRFNDAVLRNLVISRDEPITEVSPLARSKDDREERDSAPRGDTESARSDDDTESESETDSDSDDESDSAADASA